VTQAHANVGTEDVVGRTVEISQSTFLVVGVARKKIQMGTRTPRLAARRESN